jgi:hypothetical protein
MTMETDNILNDHKLQTNTDEEKKKCIVCREQIDKDAEKCTHCDSFQDWRRYFSMGTVVLSLLVALISVLTAAIPVLTTTLTPKRSDVRFSLLDYGSQRIKVVSSNLGNRAAVLKGATLFIVKNGSKQNAPIRLAWNRSDPIVEPAKWRIFEFHNEVNGVPVDLPMQSASDKSCQYRIEFDVIAFDHKPKKPSVTGACPGERH